MLHSQRASLPPAATARRGAVLMFAAGSPLRNSRPFRFSLVTRAQRAISFALRSISYLGVFFLAAELAVAGEGLSYEEGPDLTQLSLEQLVNVKVYSASKFTQKVSEAPSAVTVVTRADIRAYGYRTLADILRSIRGLYGHYDRNYNYVGVRGFARAGDFNSRILLLVDGYRINDNVYESATIGTEFVLDVDLIERVEFVPGPGSSIYGSNAFFGVINVITRGAQDIKGVELSGEIGSFDTQKGRATFGRRFENGLNLVFSATGYDSDGQDLFFPEFNSPATNNGIAKNLDHDRYESFFTKAGFEAFTLTAAHASRKKGIPTGIYSTVFNDPRTNSEDEQSFLDLKYNDTFRGNLDVLGRLFYGRYEYTGTYPYFNTDINSTVVNKDGSRSAWWGGEVRFLSTQFDNHKLVAGADYQNNRRQDQFNFDKDPFFLYSDDRRTSSIYGIYVQDEYAIRDNLTLNAGIRHDEYSTFGGITNPRLGLIYNPTKTSALKLLYGTAFRAPNAYELFYTQVSSSKGNPDLQPERIKTYELVFETYLSRNTRITATGFYNRISDLINQVTDPADGLLVFRNGDDVESKGAEFETEHLWDNGARARASYTVQQTTDKDTGELLTNSPKRLGKLNLVAPLLGKALQAGLEFQYVSARKTILGETGGYGITNLTLLNEGIAKGLELSASVYNVFDKEFSDPTGDDLTNIGLDSIRQDGRTFRLKLIYRF